MARRKMTAYRQIETAFVSAIPAWEGEGFATKLTQSYRVMCASQDRTGLMVSAALPPKMDESTSSGPRLATPGPCRKVPSSF
jgi:hypothetical protein